MLVLGYITGCIVGTVILYFILSWHSDRADNRFYKTNYTHYPLQDSYKVTHDLGYRKNGADEYGYIETREHVTVAGTTIEDQRKAWDKFLEWAGIIGDKETNERLSAIDEDLERKGL